MDGDIWRALHQRALAAFPDANAPQRTVRAAWSSRYSLRLTAKSTRLDLCYALIETDSFGCCYYDAPDGPGSLSAFVGSDALGLIDSGDAVQIAALDAVYGSLVGGFSQIHSLTGSTSDKARKRAKIVASVTRDLVGGNDSDAKVVNVGVVGDILAELVDSGFTVAASDFSRAVVGTAPHGIEVAHGVMTEELVGDADVAVVTGMTLATHTLDGILAAAQARGTKLVVFAETGANFATEYCRMGVDAVISEPWPFYLAAPGESVVRVHRRSPAA